MSARHFAFLRAINVGGHTVKMDRLRALFAELGLDAVETFIASGNVVFTAPGDAAELETRIETHLAAALGFEVATFLRTRDELAAVGAAAPFGASAGEGTVYVGFLRAAPASAARDALMAYRTGIDDFRIVGREVYWLARKGMAASTFSGARLERTLGMATTMRNMNTVHRLLKKYD